METLYVGTKKLLLIAGALWTLAGLSILQIGFTAYLQHHFALWITLAAIATFTLFYFMIFRKMVARNEQRILSFTGPKTSILKFLDKRSYFIMAIMTAFGVSLRASGLVPSWFFAFFYTGLGAALLLAGLSLFYLYFRPRPLAASSSTSL